MLDRGRKKNRSLCSMMGSCSRTMKASQWLGLGKGRLCCGREECSLKRGSWGRGLRWMRLCGCTVRRRGRLALAEKIQGTMIELSTMLVFRLTQDWGFLLRHARGSEVATVFNRYSFSFFALAFLNSRNRVPDNEPDQGAFSNRRQTHLPPVCKPLRAKEPHQFY